MYYWNKNRSVLGTYICIKTPSFYHLGRCSTIILVHIFKNDAFTLKAKITSIFSFYCRINPFELVLIIWHVPIVKKHFWKNGMRMQRNIFDRILEKNHLNVHFVAKLFLKRAIVTLISENSTLRLISIRKFFFGYFE